MCGIVGYSHIRRGLPSGLLTEALEGLAHRGPDRQKHFTCPEISLGAVRLSILDHAGGEQPFTTDDGDVVVVFNGEIFNHQQLRRELETCGCNFRTRSDTEVVAQAFCCWGTDALARLRGMFAIAIWLRSERRLILARDRMGIKPLYYYIDEDEIYFGSELKCILAHPRVDRSINLTALNRYLSLNYVPGPDTLVAGVSKLMPGCALEWRSGTLSHWSYVPKPALLVPPRSLEEASEQLDRLLSVAVSEQLVSDVPVCVWLSGGLDSSTILHYAAEAHSRPLQTFSITFRGRTFDESRHIERMASRYGTRHSNFDLNPEVDLREAIEQLPYYSDEPSADAGALPTWFLARMTRPHATVVLTGEGSDEIFGGYLTYRADHYHAVAQKIPRDLRRAALRVAMSLPVSDEKIGFEYKLKRFLEGSLLSAEAAHVFWNGTFSEEEKGGLTPFYDPTALMSLLAEVSHGPGIQRFLDFDQRYYLADDILCKVDRMSMAHSLEVRPPFLDDRIVEFAASLPESFKLRGANSKYVLRHLMRGKLPAAILRKPKIGFDIPVHDWLRGALRPLLLETLTREAIEDAGLLRWSQVKILIDDHLSRRRNLGYHLWGLITLVLWMKRWRINPMRHQMTSSQVFVAAAQESHPVPSLQLLRRLFSS